MQAAERLAVELAQQEMQAAAVERECQKLHSQLSISSEKLEGASRTISQQDEMMALLQTRLRMLEEAQEAAMATTAATRATAHSTTTSLDSHLSVAAALATSQAALVTSSRSPIKTESQVSSEATATGRHGAGGGTVTPTATASAPVSTTARSQAMGVLHQRAVDLPSPSGGSHVVVSTSQCCS
eukprot:gene8000-1226_t